MTMPREILLTGAAAGAVGALLTLVSVSCFGQAPGGLLGLACAAGVGAFGAWTAAQGLGRALTEHLILLDLSGPERPTATPAPIDGGRLDEAIRAVRDSLERARNLKTEFEEV